MSTEVLVGNKTINARKVIAVCNNYDTAWASGKKKQYIESGYCDEDVLEYLGVNGLTNFKGAQYQNISGHDIFVKPIMFSQFKTTKAGKNYIYYLNINNYDIDRPSSDPYVSYLFYDASKDSDKTVVTKPSLMKIFDPFIIPAGKKFLVESTHKYELPTAFTSTVTLVLY